ncbi:MAG: hypothetical protein JWQ48_2379 [Conexibacter sp.]|nr:hypothetical protein [Conexibacter sp.]
MPMAEQLDVDYEQVFFVPPRTDVERAFGAMRCALTLLMEFTSPEGWPDDKFGNFGGSKRTNRKAAKHFATALQTEDGRDAIAWLAKAYGRSQAQTWRRAAVAREPDEAERLVGFAGANDMLSEMVGKAWPVSDYHRVLPQVELEEKGRLFDPDNVDAMVDLRAYTEQAGVMARAVALTMGSSYADFALVIVAPLISWHMTYSVGMVAGWECLVPLWSNLLQPEALSDYDLAQELAAQREASA